MKQLLLALLLLVALLTPARPVAAQPSLLADLQAERAKYGPNLTRAQTVALLNAVAWKNRADGWGMLAKSGDNSCGNERISISCDTLIHYPSTMHFDVLIDGENTARPDWRSNGPCFLGPSSGCELSRFVPPYDPGGASPSPAPIPTTGPAPYQPPPVVAALDTSRLETVLREQAQQLYEQAERIRADQMARDAQLLAAVQGVSGQVKQHDEAPSWMGRVFGNRYVQLAMGAAGAWFTAQQTTKK